MATRRLVITTMAYGRPDILEAWCMNMRNIKVFYKNQIDIDIHVTISENVSKEIVQEFKFSWNYSDNYPVGRKANSRLQFVRTLNPDIVLLLGSDDLIGINYINYCIQKIAEGFDEVAPLDIYYYDQKSQTGAYSRGYVNHRQGEGLAVGRMVTKELLDSVGWNLWPDNINRGLDGHSRDTLSMVRKRSHYFRHIDSETIIIDVKSSESLTNFEMRPHYVSYPVVDLIHRVPELQLCL